MQLWIILFASFVVSAVSSPLTSKQYRQDYEYNEKTDAFYKLHTILLESRETASIQCNVEGAELIMITSDEDLKQIQAMMKRFPDIKFVMVASDDLPHDWVEDEDEEIPDNCWGYPDEMEECNVVNQMGEIKRASGLTYRPFVCKVAATDAPYNEECGVYSNGYESKISATGSCYKVSTGLATWDMANADCQAEGAHLVILNNAGELEIVYNMLKEKPRHSETQYFAGVRAATSTEPRVFKTVLNQTLEEVGYEPWVEGKSSKWNTNRDCLALDLHSEAKYTDVSCDDLLQYICESSGTPLVDREASRRTNRAAPQSGPVSANVMWSSFLLLSVLFV